MKRKARNRDMWGQEMVPVSRGVYAKGRPFSSSLVSSPIVRMREDVYVSLEVGKRDAKCVCGVPVRNLRFGGEGGKKEEVRERKIHDSSCA